jgi:hypothetical protein
LERALNEVVHTGKLSFSRTTIANDSMISSPLEDNSDSNQYNRSPSPNPNGMSSSISTSMSTSAVSAAQVYGSSIHYEHFNAMKTRPWDYQFHRYKRQHPHVMTPILQLLSQFLTFQRWANLLQMPFFHNQFLMKVQALLSSTIPQHLNNHDSRNFYALNERIVAAESICFAATVISICFITYQFWIFHLFRTV